MFCNTGFSQIASHMFTFTIWRYFGEFLKLVEVNSIFLKSFILRKMAYTGSRKAVFPSWCQDGFKMPLPQVDDDHVSKWRAWRWCSYLNMLKLSDLHRTTSSCHVSIQACGTNPLCVISRRKRCEAFRQCQSWYYGLSIYAGIQTDMITTL